MNMQPVISVRGEASLEVEPALAFVNVTIQARDRDRHTVLSRLASRNQHVTALIKGYGEAVEKLESGPASVYPDIREKKATERVARYLGRTLVGAAPGQPGLPRRAAGRGPGRHGARPRVRGGLRRRRRRADRGRRRRPAHLGRRAGTTLPGHGSWRRSLVRATGSTGRAGLRAGQADGDRPGRGALRHDRARQLSAARRASLPGPPRGELACQGRRGAS